MLCVLGGALVCTPKRKYWLYVNGDDICCAYGFRLVCDCEVRMSDGGFLVCLRVSANVFCKARMSGVAIQGENVWWRMSSVAFCAQEVIVDVLRLSVVFSRRYFIYLLGLRQ